MEPAQLDRIPPEIVQHLIQNLTIAEVLNFCQTNQYYQEICDSDYFWREYARNMPMNNLEYNYHNIPEAVQLRIKPVVDRYVIDGNNFLFILSAAAKFNDIELLNRILDIYLSKGERPSDFHIGEMAIDLLKNRRLYAAESLYSRFPGYRALAQLIIGFFLYGYKEKRIEKYLTNPDLQDPDGDLQGEGLDLSDIIEEAVEHIGFLDRIYNPLQFTEEFLKYLITLNLDVNYNRDALDNAIYDWPEERWGESEDIRNYQPVIDSMLDRVLGPAA